jgi:hydrogenase maturation protease
VTGRVLVAGIGNVLCGDDGFGVALAQRLIGAGLPADVVEYGIRGVHLAYDLLDRPPGTLVLLDAVPLGAEPGALVVLEIGADDVAGPPVAEAHSMNPQAVLSTLSALGGRIPPRVLVVGCKPAVLEPVIGLSDAVSAALPRAEQLVRELLDADHESHSPQAEGTWTPQNC